MDRIEFYYDIGCEWCYLTWRWLRQLEAVDEVRLRYCVCSVDLIACLAGGGDLVSTQSDSALSCAAAAIHRSSGPDSATAFYERVGRRLFDRVPPATDTDLLLKRVAGELGFADLVQDQGAMQRGWEDILSNAERVIAQVGKGVGLPVIILEDGVGPGVFGPVISQVPRPGEDILLWHHVRWLVNCEIFSELKRKRKAPRLNAVSWRRARQAEEARSGARSQ